MGRGGRVNPLVGLVFCVPLSFTFSCVSKQKTTVQSRPAATSPEVTATKTPAPLSEIDSKSGVCPSGSEFSSQLRSCVTRGGFVLGPFPIELQELCRENFPNDAGTCVQRQDWPVEFFTKLSSAFKDGCAPGTQPMPVAGCLSSGSVYGPFTLQQVMSCRAKMPAADQSQCDQLVWSEDVFNRVQQFVESQKPALVISETQKPAGVIDEVQKPSTVPLDSQKPALIKIDPVQSSTPSPGSIEQKSPQTTKTPGTEKKLSEKLSVKPSDEPQVELPKVPTYCIYSWDERPGTADFSTRNQRFVSLGQSTSYWIDRDESDSLLRSREFQNFDMCSRARFLKKCFQRVILESDSPAAQTFRAWSLGRVRPIEAHMAFVMKESRLGLWPDQCWKGQCKGIGIAKVTRARTTSGRLLAPSDSMWNGITHNIITNLDFSLRQIAEKTTSGPTDLYALAFLYRGKSRMQERYAMDVDRYYKELIACQLDE